MRKNSGRGKAKQKAPDSTGVLSGAEGMHITNGQIVEVRITMNGLLFAVSLLVYPHLLSFCEKITNDGVQNILLALGQLFYSGSRFVTEFSDKCGYDQSLRL